MGIDYGRKKVGLAMSTEGMATPLSVLKYEDQDKLLIELEKVVDREKVERVVIGVSEGQMARESLDFAKMVEEKLQLVVDVEDETLTSRDAQRLSIEAGIKRKKRRNMEDAYSAALMLQKYLDNLA
ncbi:MAG: hypothetical protein UV56_C0002G0003 [Candidatus Woesebacteria bacterium GW2011_GWC1_43_10b]|uniref:Putative pre-16S rRNA nuclease n=2 Tax=Candidatus Woeseibacteriota TaxID=1752722 RepID=A0A0G1F2H3_9BACT|nr:MAG: hypothetical protein UV56_C0002G0003 [Candidatus Woesebacteria bacterium GW2011_GWC1_43_10b]